MKRLLIVMFLIGILVACLGIICKVGAIAAEPATPAEATWNMTQLQGDVDGDGRVSIGDLMRVELMMMDTLPETPAADVNRDGKVGIADVLVIEIIMRDGHWE